MFIKGINRLLASSKVFWGTWLFIPFFAFSQQDTTVFKEVTITANHFKANQQTILKENQIKQLAPHDLGTLLQYINGITIKNYGGIGGMKTLSHRGLGGEHSLLVVDGFPVYDPQNGQTNLANIQPHNLEEVKVSHQNSNDLLSISALIKGSDIQLKSFDQQFSPHLLSARSSVTIGSFGQKEAFFALKNGGKKSFISLTGGWRTYKGNYPYQLLFGNEKVNFTRRNNALDDYHLSIGGGLKWEKNKIHHIVKLSAKTNSIHQELPGAVIFYNNMAQETLKTKKSSVGVNYTFFSNQLKAKAFTQYAHRYLHYHDPTFLNAEGFIDNRYTTNSLIGGFHLQYLWNNFSFHAGNDSNYDVLLSSRNLGNPTRYSHTSMLKGNYQFPYFLVETGLFSQVFTDENKLQDHRKSYHKFHPQLSVYTSDKLCSNWQFLVWYKPSSRAPSFNELYYSQVGNKALEPEESSQFNVGFKYLKTESQLNFQISGNFFKNQVNNKILALPTQNLFVWSIQNIGKVEILGGDFNFMFNYTINKDWKTNLRGGLNYQKAVDISNKNAPTYRHQIAYTPAFTGNGTWMVSFKNIGLHLTGLYIGERYSLNENIENNRLDAYIIFDGSASYSIKIKNQHTVNIHAGIKNIKNESYNFIRYYVMPGRNYFIKLSYAFN